MFQEPGVSLTMSIVVCFDDLFRKSETSLVSVFHHYNQNREAMAVDLMIRPTGHAVNDDHISLSDCLVWKKLAVKNVGCEHLQPVIESCCIHGLALPILSISNYLTFFLVLGMADKEEGAKKVWELEPLRGW